MEAREDVEQTETNLGSYHRNGVWDRNTVTTETQLYTIFPSRRAGVGKWDVAFGSCVSQFTAISETTAERGLFTTGSL